VHHELHRARRCCSAAATPGVHSPDSDHWNDVRRTLSALTLTAIAFGSLGFAEVEAVQSEQPAVCLNLTETSPLLLLLPRRTCVETRPLPLPSDQF
jgi:hypothetical protein